MMNKNDKTELLFSRIGEIDDQLLNEAITYKRSRRKIYNFGMLAACLTLILAVAVIFPMLNRIGGVSGDKNSDAVIDPMNKYVSLDAVFVDSYGGSYKKLDSFESLSYVGKASLVWQYSDSGEIYSRSLSASELEKLTEKMGRGEQVGERSPKLECIVWVLDGEGNVISPYLKDGAGNVGCEVFDYEVEIIPDDSFVECVSDILY